MIQNIVFDMGNVLMLYDPSRILEPYPEEARPLLQREIFRSVEWIKRDRGTISTAEALASICRRLPEHLYPAAAELLEQWYEAMTPMPGMERLIHHLKLEGYRLFILSNTCDQYRVFRRYIPAIRLFDGEFTSAQCHLLKPDRAIFRAFFERFGLEPAECFFIDDSAPNIEAAELEGMGGFLYHGDLSALRRSLRAAGVEL